MEAIDRYTISWNGKVNDVWIVDSNRTEIETVQWLSSGPFNGVLSNMEQTGLRHRSYIENITFKINEKPDNIYDDSLVFIEDSSVYIQNCKFIHGNMFCSTNGTLNIQHCKFVQCPCGINMGCLSGNVNVIGCTFVECGTIQHYSLLPAILFPSE
eukprot:626774_1